MSLTWVEEGGDVNGVYANSYVVRIYIVILCLLACVYNASFKLV